MQWTTIRLGPTRVHSYSYLLPAFVLAIGWAFGKGLPSVLTVPGILIGLAASLVIRRGEVFAGRSASAAGS